MGGFHKFSLLDATFVIGSILTFIADQATDIILSITFFLDGHPQFCAATLVLMLVPNAIVQIFSARWNQLDEYSSKPITCIHGMLLGTLHRYYRVLTLGLVARSSDDEVDYQRYYQQWSDICMLRLFDSFMESAPQLVFQLYVLIEVSDWSTFNVTWTCVSAVASMVSLGWGVAAYSQALRMVREDKSKMTWLGMILQTIWRFSMLASRIVALVLISLTLHKWVFVVIGAHWLLMTGWVIWQNTDFCTNKMEERLYNAVVGVIYCFCFFNLKEGRSRYRMICFYLIMFLENTAFLAAYYWCSHHTPGIPVTWFSLGAMVIVLGGTAVGLISLALYYRYFHPAGPIYPCGGKPREKPDLEKAVSVQSPDFTIKDATYLDEKDGSLSRSLEEEDRSKKSLKHSRSFKYSTQTKVMVRGGKNSPVVLSALDLINSSNGSNGPSSPTEECKISERLDSAYGTDSNRTASRNTESSHTFPLVEKSPTESYAVANQNNSGSTLHQDRSSSSLHNCSVSSAAFNNETYMSIDGSSQHADQSYMSLSSPTLTQGAQNQNNTYQSVHPMSDTSLRSEQNTSQGSQTSRITVIDNTASTPKRPQKDLLKRSPVLRDITEGFTPIPPVSRKDESDLSDDKEKGKERLHAPLTIIIPNISNQAVTKSNSSSPDQWSDKTISLDILNPGANSKDLSSFSNHDYENLALVNINRAPIDAQHWRTYSDMANSRHDESTKYERNKLNFTSSSDYSNYSTLAFCDIYPLSKAMKDQLYRSLTPVSTTATMASSLDTSDSNHTYEPIETAQEMSRNVHSAPLTLIHHDGRKVTANRIVSLETLRETLHQHESVPFDDPESRGDLYILAPMRLLTPVLEESDSDLTRSKLYQSLASMSTNSQMYSDMDTSIMSIISEVLNVRSEQRSQRTLISDRSQPKLPPIEEDSLDTCSLLHTIEEIRNSSLCNLYYSSSSDLSKPTVPLVPPRNTLGYESLIKENQESKSGSKVVLPESEDLNNTIKSVHSNTLVVTPPTVRAQKSKPTPLNVKVGVRKNILNLVGSTNDILNTPKRVKLLGSEKLTLPTESNLLSDSLVSEKNEFKSLMPHLTTQGVKFLSKVKATSGTESELETSNSTILSSRFNPDFSTFTATPSPKPFVRNVGNNILPKRKFSVPHQRFETADDNSDYKYGFMPENPDAKYGFGVFGTENYNLVETAKLCNSSLRESGRSQCVPAPVSANSYSLSVLNRGDKDFKLHPDEQYANFHRNWVSTSLHKQSGKQGIGGRTDTNRRSMSILDDYEEKENIGPDRPAPPPKRRPLATVNKTSPMKILGNNLRLPDTRVYRLNPDRTALSPKPKLFRKRCDT